MKLCKTCSTVIPPERLEIIPNTEYCVGHSVEKPKRGFISGAAESKNWEVTILDGDDLSVSYWEDRQGRY